MIPMPNPQEAVELIRNNEKEVEKRFVKWAQDYHRQTGRFAEKAEAEEAVPKIMVEYVLRRWATNPSTPKCRARSRRFSKDSSSLLGCST